jgi:hypothetical protein
MSAKEMIDALVRAGAPEGSQALSEWQRDKLKAIVAEHDCADLDAPGDWYSLNGDPEDCDTFINDTGMRREKWDRLTPEEQARVPKRLRPK